ncbi:cupin domain-containing protein [Lactobacillus amylovorus]|uniref:cupin domain-containing protein n=1 Tax=Lactobacillus amylovorus TaxID=1604 RepID=UPI003F9D8C0F
MIPAVSEIAKLIASTQGRGSLVNLPIKKPDTSFFDKDDPIKVKIVKHNRYTTPLTHNHDFYEMFYVLEGEFTQSIGNQRFLMQTGDVLFITHFM